MAVFLEAPFPQVDGHLAAAQLLRQLAIGAAVGEAENQPGPLRIAGPQAAGPSSSRQLLAPCFGEDDGLNSRALSMPEPLQK